MAAALAFTHDRSEAHPVFDFKTGAYDADSLIEFLAAVHDHFTRRDGHLDLGPAALLPLHGHERLDRQPAPQAGRGAITRLRTRTQPRRVAVGQRQRRRARQPRPGDHRPRTSRGRGRTPAGGYRLPVVLQPSRAHRTFLVTKLLRILPKPLQSANTSRLCWTKNVWSWPLLGSAALYFALVADPSGRCSSG
jgi:hypothetical protein